MFPAPQRGGQPRAALAPGCRHSVPCWGDKPGTPFVDSHDHRTTETQAEGRKTFMDLRDPGIDVEKEETGLLPSNGRRSYWKGRRARLFPTGPLATVATTNPSLPLDNGQTRTAQAT